jgi:hypothetical protein
LKVSEEVFDSRAMLFSWIDYEAAQARHCKDNIWSCTQQKVHEESNCLCVLGSKILGSLHSIWSWFEACNSHGC